MTECSRCKLDVNTEFLVLKSKEKETKLEFCQVCMNECRRLFHSFLQQGLATAPYSDEDIIPMGKYGRTKTKLKDVPNDYIEWLSSQDWLAKNIRLKLYVDTRMRSITQQKNSGNTPY